MNKKFLIDEKFRALLELQRHECRRKRQKNRKYDGEELYNELEIIYNEFSGHLAGSGLNVLDVGCGLGFIDVIINDNIKDCNFYIFDSMNSVKAGSVKNFYCNLSLTKEFMCMHGVSSDSIFLVDASRTGEDVWTNKDPKCFSGLPKMDLVLSMFSWGWHFSLEKYIKEASSITNKGGLLVLECKNKSLTHSERESILNNNEFELIDVCGEERRHRIMAKKL